VRYHTYEGSGFQFLFNAQRAKLNGSAHVSWHLNRPEALFPNRPTEGVVLRAHLLGKGEEVIVCDGKPQLRRTWPETVKFLLRRRIGEDLESTFVTVFEPYRHRPFIESVGLVPVTPSSGMPVAVEVIASGQQHVVFSQLEGVEAQTIAVDGGSVAVAARAAVWVRDAGGKVSRAYQVDGSGTRWGTAALKGKSAVTTEIASVDYERGQMTLAEDALAGRSAAGSIGVVESDAHSAAIPVLQAADSSFSVGDDDLIAASLTIRKVSAEGLHIYPSWAYWGEPGMTVIDEARSVVGRVVSFERGVLRIGGSREGLTDFPDSDGDGRRRVVVVVVGPGDRLTLHSSVRLLAP